MVDLTIKGAGIFGLTIAWQALRRGVKVQVIDPGGPGAGASGGIVGALAPHTPDGWNPKKQLQLESLIAHRAMWGEVDEISRLSSGYAATGRLQPLLDDHAVTLAREREEMARITWAFADAEWHVTDDPGEFAPPSPTGLYVKDTLSAHLHPKQACASLAKAITVLGGGIVDNAQDEGTVIWATGAAGLARLNVAAKRVVGAPVKGQAALLDFDARGAPQLFADALHLIPHLDGTLAVGSTTERVFDAPTDTDHGVEELIAKARGVLPALADAPVLARWAGLRPRMRSRAPAIGPVPDQPGHFFANGGFKIGFGMAPKVAELILDLVLKDEDKIPDLFRLNASL